MSDIKFAHGTKANAEAAVADGRLDLDDLVIFSETNDEIGIVDHENTLQRIKSRTNKDIVLTDEAIGNIPAGYTIPAGTSIDDLVNLFKTWLLENKNSLNLGRAIPANANNFFNPDNVYNKGDIVAYYQEEHGQHQYFGTCYECLVDNFQSSYLDRSDTTTWKYVGVLAPVAYLVDDAVDSREEPALTSIVNVPEYDGLILQSRRISNYLSAGLEYDHDMIKLSPATTSTLGGVKVGSGLNVTDSGVLSIADDEQSIEWGNIGVERYYKDTTYSKGEYVVSKFEEDGETIITLWVYESLVDDNLGNPLPTNFMDNDYWKSIGKLPIQLGYPSSMSKEVLEEGGLAYIAAPRCDDGMIKIGLIPPSLFVASKEHAGFVQPGDGLSITSEGVLSVTSSGGTGNKLLATMDLGAGSNNRFKCVVKIYTQYITITLTVVSGAAANQLNTASMQKPIEEWDLTASFDSATRALFTPFSDLTIGNMVKSFVTFNGKCVDGSYRDEYDYPLWGRCEIITDDSNIPKSLEISVLGNSYYDADSTRTFYFPSENMGTQAYWSQTFTFLNANAIPTE